MKTIAMFLMSMTIITYSMAQSATVKTKAGEEKRILIKAHSNDAIFTDQGNIKFTDISTINFESDQERDASLYNRLSAAGVQVSFGNQVKEITATSSIPLIVQQQEPIDIGVSKFVEQRTVGKVLQFIGVAAIGASVYLNSQYSKKVVKDPDTKEPPKFLPGIGLAAMGIGIVIDIDAGRHLKKKH